MNITTQGPFPDAVDKYVAPVCQWLGTLLDPRLREIYGIYMLDKDEAVITQFCVIQKSLPTGQERTAIKETVQVQIKGECVITSSGFNQIGRMHLMLPNTQTFILQASFSFDLATSQVSNISVEDLMVPPPPVGVFLRIP